MELKTEEGSSAFTCCAMMHKLLNLSVALAYPVAIVGPRRGGRSKGGSMERSNEGFGPPRIWKAGRPLLRSQSHY